jgi:hypothetical protein
MDVPDNDRTKLAIPDPPFKGTVNRTLTGKALQAALADAQEKMKAAG